MSDLVSFFEGVRNRLLLSDLVRSTVKLTKRGREFSGLCPFHSEKGPSFTVNDEKGFYHCFGCGAHGSHVDFLMKKQGLPFREAIELLSEKSQVPLPPFSFQKQGAVTTQPKKETYKDVYQALEAAACWFQAQLRGPLGRKAQAYLKDRGLNSDSVLNFRLGYAPTYGLKEALVAQGFSLKTLINAGLLSQPEDEGRHPYDRFRDRLMFPIHDIKGAVIAFGGRLLGAGDPKYLNSSETSVFHKGKSLYALDKAVGCVKEDSPFIVVEGYMDVIALHQAGYSTAVAPLGTALTADQLHIMWRRCARPILCFDGDAAGRKAAHRSALKCLDYISANHTLSFCFLPQGEDPDSLMQSGEQETFNQLTRAPFSLADTLWHFLMEGRGLSAPEDKANARKEMNELIHTIKDTDVKHFYFEDFKARLSARLRQNSPYFLSRDREKSRAVPISPPLFSVKKNKSYLKHKILLASVLNHPILVGQVVEQLMEIEDLSEQYEALRTEIVDTMLQNPSLSRHDLVDSLHKKGFATEISELMSSFVSHQAPFIHPITPLETVQKGWQDVWQRLVEDKHLTTETQQAAVEAKSTLDFSSWERLKRLKQTFLKQ